MSEPSNQNELPQGEPSVKHSGFVWLLIALVGLETLVLLATFGWLVSQLFSSTSESFRTALALTALVGIIAAWLVATTIGLARRSRWARGSVITWQVLQFAVAFGATQGDHPNWLVATLLAVPAVAVGVLANIAPVRTQFGAADTLSS